LKNELIAQAQTASPASSKTRHPNAESMAAQQKKQQSVVSCTVVEGFRCVVVVWWVRAQLRRTTLRNWFAQPNRKCRRPVKPCLPTSPACSQHRWNHSCWCVAVGFVTSHGSCFAVCHTDHAVPTPAHANSVRTTHDDGDRGSHHTATTQHKQKHDGASSDLRAGAVRRAEGNVECIS